MESESSRLLPTAIATEEGVYGIILVSGLVAAAAAAGADSLHALLFVGVTLIVFWVAHVYAGTVAEHGTVDGEVVGLRTAMLRAVQRSRGLVFSGAVPALPLLLGAVGVWDDRTAAWVALWVAVAVLGLLGYTAYHRKRAPMHMRIIGALSTASFGVVIIVAKTLIQH